MAGATGYVGSRLVPELLGRGYDVVAAASSTPAPERFSWGRDVRWAQMPATDPSAVRAALRGADGLVYLVHSLSMRDFRSRDAHAARTVRAGAAQAGLERIVYLSGLQPATGGWLSGHLASRLEVEGLLAAGPTPVLALRAGIVLGAGSTSFEILRQAATLSPVRVVPSWLRSRVQPVGVADVVTALADACGEPVRAGAVDLGGPEVLTYAELTARYCDLAGLVRPALAAPRVPMELVAPLAGLFCAAPWWTVAALVRSLEYDLVCRPAPDLWSGATGLAEAITRSLRVPSDPGEATSYGGDPHVRAASDPDWTQDPRWDGRLLGLPVLPRGPARALSHVAEHRLRGLAGRRSG